jgi:hypothetical protein
MVVIGLHRWHWDGRYSAPYGEATKRRPAGLSGIKTGMQVQIVPQSCVSQTRIVSHTQRGV